jgi:hypothetical protein
MVNPERVINQVIEGPLPATWRVFRGQGNPVAAAIFAGIFIFIFVFLCQGIAVVGGVMFMGGATLFSLFNPSSHSISYDPTSSSGTIDPTSFQSPTPFPFDMPLVVLIALFLLLPLLLTWLAVRKTLSSARTARDSVLVITPEGVVHCANVSQPLRRSYKVLDFAEVNDLQLRIWTHDDTTTTTDPATGMTTSRTTSSHTDFWLDVQERNGNYQRWPLTFPGSRPEILAQSIIEAHARYRAQS